MTVPLHEGDAGIAGRGSSLRRWRATSLEEGGN